MQTQDAYRLNSLPAMIMAVYVLATRRSGRALVPAATFS